ncbi:MAG: polysaccharide biosynthesis tyrosine autokinase [Burkholderiaceae bacterium]
MSDRRSPKVPNSGDAGAGRAEPSLGSLFDGPEPGAAQDQPVDAEVVSIREGETRRQRRAPSANQEEVSQPASGESRGDLVPNPGAGGPPEPKVPRATHLPAGPTKVTPRIGEILVSTEAMKSDQIEKVLSEQAREPEKRFGEIAVHRRLATQAQVDSALASQFGYTAPAAPDTALPAEIAVAHTPYSPFAEVIRALRSQLVMRWFDGSPQQCALSITSVDRGDGKSFICANLGVVFSQLGERTLIIDADLRNSTQHKKFGLPNRMGLSGILSGRAGIEEILPVPGVENLAVLPAGPLPPNPQELLGREEFGKLLFGLSESFDVILVDTPSAQQATDAQIVAQKTRAAMIVGRKDKTQTNEIGQLTQVMRGSGIQILGATLNNY